MRERQRIRNILALVILAGAAPAGALANPGDINKWSQLPGGPMMGYNRGSSFDWRDIMHPPPQQLPNWAVADDFRNVLNLPVASVRWWGSYATPNFEPRPGPIPGVLDTVEDGWTVSFFRDIPRPIPSAPPSPTNFSLPGELLATWVARPEAVRYTPLNYQGWDQENVWEYEVNLKDMCLAHANPNYVDPTGSLFLQRPTDQVYWVSIAAENGHEIIVRPDGTWFSEPNGDVPITFDHFWGWHTSPTANIDWPTMGGLFMPDQQTWIYGPWQPIPPDHMTSDQAFEIYAIPAPGSAVLLALGAFAVRRRRV